MESYYVIRNEEGFLSNISSNYINTSGQYYNAIKLSTQTMAEQFKLYCESVATGIEFTIYEVTITLTEVTISAVGE